MQTEFLNKVMSAKWAMEKRSLLSLLHCCVQPTQMAFSQSPSPMNDKGNMGNTGNGGDTGDTALITISGVLTKSANGLSDMELAYGFASVDDITDELNKAAKDPTVSRIVLGFGSPGGETTGIIELGRLIRKIDTTIKPVYGWVEQQAASAAYWLLSQVRPGCIGMTESATVGSVGVYVIIPEMSEYYKQAGINIQPVSSDASKYKLMGHDFRPLTDDEKDILQKDVNDQYDKFKKTVQSTRKIKDEDLNGLSYEGLKAKELGYCDIVCDTLDDFLLQVG